MHSRCCITDGHTGVDLAVWMLPVAWLLTEKFTKKISMSTLLKCLHRSAPQYVQELCVPVTNSASRHHLRSAAHSDLQVVLLHMELHVPPSSGTAFQPHFDTRK